MDTLKKIFPFSFRGKDNTSLIIAIVVYILISFVAGVASALTSAIPVLGTIIGIVLSLAGIYTLVGIVLAILYRVEAIK